VRRLGRRAAGAVLALASWTAGCGRPAAPPVGWPVVVPALHAVRQLALPPAWTARLAAPPVAVEVAPDGSVAAGEGAAGPWAVGADGVAVRLAASQGVPYPLAGGLVAVASADGLLTVYGPDGGLLWSRRGMGPWVVTSAPRGGRVLAVDEGDGSATLLAEGTGGLRQLARVSGLGEDVQGLLDARGDALLVSSAMAVWLDGAQGAPAWTLRGAPPVASEQLALSASGRWVAVATGPGDDTLYAFDVSGPAPRLAWYVPLPPSGGAWGVAVLPSDDAVVWAAEDPTLAAYRGADGALLWQDTLPPPASGGGRAILAVAPGPDGGVAALVAPGPTSALCVLLLDAAGAPVGLLPLPGAGPAALAANGSAVAAVVTQGDGPALAWWSLAGAWRALAGPA
jgi:hypothetical protein